MDKHTTRTNNAHLRHNSGLFVGLLVQINDNRRRLQLPVMTDLHIKRWCAERRRTQRQIPATEQLVFPTVVAVIAATKTLVAACAASLAGVPLLFAQGKQFRSVVEAIAKDKIDIAPFVDAFVRYVVLWHQEALLVQAATLNARRLFFQQLYMAFINDEQQATPLATVLAAAVVPTCETPSQYTFIAISNVILIRAVVCFINMLFSFLIFYLFFYFFAFNYSRIFTQSLHGTGSLRPFTHVDLASILRRHCSRLSHSTVASTSTRKTCNRCTT